MARAAKSTIELLYFEGCPGHEQLLPTLREVASEHGVEVSQRRVETAEDAEHTRFLGSPSVRVNGVDVEPGAHERTDFGLRCRLYRCPGGLRPVPPREWIERALRR
jgi:hypothetical protein